MKKILAGVILTLTVVSGLSAEYLFKNNINKGLKFSAQEEAQEIGLSNVSCGYYHCLALKDGEVWSIGYNGRGTLGTGDTADRNTWHNTAVTATQVKVLNYLTSAIKKDGTLWLAGENSYGQFGLGDQNDRTSFTNTNLPINNLSTDLAGGRFHLIAISNGTIWGAGKNNHGELGLGHTNMITTFTDSSVAADRVEAASYSSFYLKNNILYSTGENTYGQLGLGDRVQRQSWVQSTTGVTEIESGYYHMGIIKNGTLHLVGINNYGQIANSNTTDQNLWFNTNESVTDFELGHYQTYIIKNGNLWSAGYNGHGQLCSGSGPVSVSNFTDSTYSATKFYDLSNSAYTVHFERNGQRHLCGHDGYGISGDNTKQPSITAPKLAIEP